MLKPMKKNIIHNFMLKILVYLDCTYVKTVGEAEKQPRKTGEIVWTK